MKSTVEPVDLEYRGRIVHGMKLMVCSELPIKLDHAWKEVQKSSLLEFVSKGMVSFRPITDNFPSEWHGGSIVKTRMLLWGIIPFGGIHTLKFVKIDSKSKTLLTHEYNRIVKVWNHKISMKKLSSEKIEYSDEIEIYGGLLTKIITFWAKLFYKHRQRKWLLVAQRNRRT